MYIREQPGWPHLTWNAGRLLGSMARLGFDVKLEAQLEALTQDVIKSSEIEGEILDRDSVRSSIAGRPADRRRRRNDARLYGEP